MGPPACLIELMGDAPVPPSWPDTCTTSALALATPLATTPMPASATSLTDTLADGFTCAGVLGACALWRVSACVIACTHACVLFTAQPLEGAPHRGCKKITGHAHIWRHTDLVQVMDELGQVLDGVNVVVGGRGDEGHTRL